MKYLAPLIALLLAALPVTGMAETPVIGPLAQEANFPDDDDDRPELFEPEAGDSDPSNFETDEGDSDPDNFRPEDGDSEPDQYERILERAPSGRTAVA